MRNRAQGGFLTRRPVITLTTDFGLADHFVGVMKGVILNINPEAHLVDLSHEVAAHDILDAAFLIAQSYGYFPRDTIHLVVVDPGVGSDRRPILATTNDYKFVAPDNGVLSFLYDREHSCEVRHLTNQQYFLKPVSQTFHGRDIFSPVAGWLSKGAEVDRFGERITDYVRLAMPAPVRSPEGIVTGLILKVDSFGNLITNLTPQDAPELFSKKPPSFMIVINHQKVAHFFTSYSAGQPSELFVILGSSGYLEVATNQGSAATVLRASRGDEVKFVPEGSGRQSGITLHPGR
jgi:S-adenosyl-L-methionine hydrolase (adenosine-forming)